MSITSNPVPQLAPAPAQMQYLVILSIALCHFINDVMQSVLSSIYPLLHDEFGLSFSQVGLMSLAFMGTASVLQPLVGTLTDKHPFPQSLTLGMASTMIGLILLATAPSYPFLLAGAATSAWPSWRSSSIRSRCATSSMAPSTSSGRRAPG